MKNSLSAAHEVTPLGADGLPLDVIPASWLEADEVDAEQVPPTPILADRLLDVNEAARYVGCHANTIYAAAQSGALRCRKVGRLRRFTVSDLDAWTGGEAT